MTEGEKLLAECGYEFYVYRNGLKNKSIKYEHAQNTECFIEFYIGKDACEAGVFCIDNSIDNYQYEKVGTFNADLAKAIYIRLEELDRGEV